jgi:pimeloyl-ACP methyl ester carboxylesterase
MMPLTAGEPRASDKLRPPSLSLMLAEVRGIFEFNTSLLLAPLLMRAPRGDGHPVLALPGFLASDLSMAPLRRYLSELGYDAHAWQMGRNIGGVSRMRSSLRDRLTSIHATAGRKVSIVGWSLGGVYARDLALQAPEMVRGVVTLASPFAGDVRATNATQLYEAMSGETVEEDSELRRAIAGDLPVPATSIYSSRRRHRELAHLPVACVRYRGKYRGPSCQPYRHRRQCSRIMGDRGSSGPTRGAIQPV